MHVYPRKIPSVIIPVALSLWYSILPFFPEIQEYLPQTNSLSYILFLKRCENRKQKMGYQTC